MRFSIITPSFRQPEWLRLCMASVADQEGIEVEHIVQDSESGPEVAALADEFPRARILQEKDRGMYDAVNRGLRKSTGDICAYLNCDEQYLPGALRRVAERFEREPELDLLFGDVVVTDPEGRYMCSRRVLVPLPWHTRVCFLNTFTAAMFFRRRVVEQHGLSFDENLRVVGDQQWVLGALERGLRMGVLREYLSAFVDSGENLCLAPVAQVEIRAVRARAPAWMRWGAPLWSVHHRLRRLFAGMYRIQPFFYDVHLRSRPLQAGRIRFEVARGRGRWPGR